MLHRPLDSSASHRLKACISKSHPEFCFVMFTVVLDFMLGTQRHREVVVHRLVVQEMLLNHVPAITEAQYEFV